MNQTTKFLLLVALLLLLNSSTSADSVAGRTEAKMKLLPIANVRVEDSFWAPKLRVYREKTIPHSWNYMGWEIRALQTANGQKVEGDLNGTWGEANLYKFMETCAYSLGMHPDKQLEGRMDEIIELIAGAQQPDGFVHAFITNSKKIPWDPGFLDGSHDGYVLGHMIEAAVEYYASTGKKRFLEIALKAADQAYEHFLGPKGTPGFCGHAELEMALVELYRVVPDTRYRDLSRAFVEWRGRGKVRPYSDTPRAYFQDEVPLRQQKSLNGHAVRAIFFATGVTDIAIETGDCDYRLAANRFWDSVTLRRMYVTGSVGSRKEHEAFGEDYELPNDGYCESCAACGLADFAQRRFMLERTSDAADVLERVLYNAILHSISLDGTTTYYQNPLSDRDNLRYNSWVCCPPNISRTLFQLGRYAYGYAGNDIYLNLFVGGNGKVPLTGGTVELEVETDYPWDGRVEVKVASPERKQFSLHLRIPWWCRKARLMVNGAAVEPLPVKDDGYAVLERTWITGDKVTLDLDMPVLRIEAHPNVKSCSHRVALQRGPIVYGFEAMDNDGDVDVLLDADPKCKTEWRPGLLGGVTVINGRRADGGSFLAVPFYALANRGKSRQEVWVRQRNLKADHRWWRGDLYRPVNAERTGKPAI